MQLTLVITIGAPLIIMLVIINADKFREPLDLIIKTFFMGIFICLIAAGINPLVIPSDEYAFIAGITEESLKFLVMFYYIRLKKSFNEPMDAIVYGTIISLGFATLENIEYVYFSHDPVVSSLAIAIVRALSAIPLHAACGVIMGYFFGLYAFNASKRLLTKSLLIPILIHGIYNYLATYYSYLWFLFLCAVIFYTLQLHKEFSNLQKNKNIEYEKKLI